jgi:hypothetical protein
MQLNLHIMWIRFAKLSLIYVAWKDENMWTHYVYISSSTRELLSSTCEIQNVQRAWNIKKQYIWLQNILIYLIIWIPFRFKGDDKWVGNNTKIHNFIPYKF